MRCWSSNIGGILQYWVIIVAGGSGTRMGSTIPKQFLRLQGRAVIRHSMERFYKALPEAQQIIVLPADHLETFHAIMEDDPIEAEYQTAIGGDTRYHSVSNGLGLIQETEGVVGVHDAVRPLVSINVIQEAFQIAKEKGNAIPAIPLKDSIREVIDTGNKALDRSSYRLIQTPQCFQVEVLKKAYERPFSKSFTDDASVVEADGGIIHLVPGNEENIKITSPVDIPLAEVLLPGIR